MSALAFDRDLLRRHERPGPRYTSYPTAPQFVESFDEAALRAAIDDSNGDPIPRPLSLYVHVPFCLSPCFYCGCNRTITRDARRGEAYLADLAREVARIAPLFDRDREVVQLHFGGGTPNFLGPQQLRATVDMLRRHFRFSDRRAGDSRAVDSRAGDRRAGDSRDRDISIELDPRTVMPEDIAVLAAAGFNRASLGVQDVDREVQAAVNRVQSIEQTRAVIEACREHGLRSVNVDLIYGLPRQTEASFRRTLATVLTMRPDRFAVYGYAHLPQLFKAQRRIDAADLPDAETRLALLQAAIETLTAAGYDYIGMDHFALPDDELAQALARGGLHRNFMGYTTHADSDLIGLGVSAISHIGATYSQNPREEAGWRAALDAGRLPVFRGMAMSADDRLRADLIQTLMCRGEVPIAALEHRYGIDFAAYFADGLQRLRALQDDGLVRIEAERIAVTPRGRLLLRNIAMCFDRYLAPPQGASAGADTDGATRYSRAI